MPKITFRDACIIERSMSPSLIAYRTEIMKRLLKMADRMYNNANEINKAF